MVGFHLQGSGWLLFQIPELHHLGMFTSAWVHMANLLQTPSVCNSASLCHASWSEMLSSPHINMQQSTTTAESFCIQTRFTLHTVAAIQGSLRGCSGTVSVKKTSCFAHMPHFCCWQWILQCPKWKDAKCVVGLAIVTAGGAGTGKDLPCQQKHTWLDVSVREGRNWREGQAGFTIGFSIQLFPQVWNRPHFYS